jgi:hypothetical protein
MSQKRIPLSFKVSSDTEMNGARIAVETPESIRLQKSQLVSIPSLIREVCLQNVAQYPNKMYDQLRQGLHLLKIPCGDPSDMRRIAYEGLTLSYNTNNHCLVNWLKSPDMFLFLMEQCPNEEIADRVFNQRADEFYPAVPELLAVCAYYKVNLALYQESNNVVGGESDVSFKLVYNYTDLYDRPTLRMVIFNTKCDSRLKGLDFRFLNPSRPFPDSCIQFEDCDRFAAILRNNVVFTSMIYIQDYKAILKACKDYSPHSRHEDENFFPQYVLHTMFLYSYMIQALVDDSNYIYHAKLKDRLKLMLRLIKDAKKLNVYDEVNILDQTTAIRAFIRSVSDLCYAWSVYNSELTDSSKLSYDLEQLHSTGMPFYIQTIMKSCFSASLPPGHTSNTYIVKGLSHLIQMAFIFQCKLGPSTFEYNEAGRLEERNCFLHLLSINSHAPPDCIKFNLETMASLLSVNYHVIDVSHSHNPCAIETFNCNYSDPQKMVNQIIIINHGIHYKVNASHTRRDRTPSPEGNDFWNDICHHLRNYFAKPFCVFKSILTVGKYDHYMSEFDKPSSFLKAPENYLSGSTLQMVQQQRRTSREIMNEVAFSGSKANELLPIGVTCETDTEKLDRLRPKIIRYNDETIDIDYTGFVQISTVIDKRDVLNKLMIDLMAISLKGTCKTDVAKLMSGISFNVTILNDMITMSIKETNDNKIDVAKWIPTVMPHKLASGEMYVAHYFKNLIAMLYTVRYFPDLKNVSDKRAAELYFVSSIAKNISDSVMILAGGMDKVMSYTSHITLIQHITAIMTKDPNIIVQVRSVLNEVRLNHGENPSEVFLNTITKCVDVLTVDDLVRKKIFDFDPYMNTIISKLPTTLYNAYIFKKILYDSKKENPEDKTSLTHVQFVELLTECHRDLLRINPHKQSQDSNNSNSSSRHRKRSHDKIDKEGDRQNKSMSINATESNVVIATTETLTSKKNKVKREHKASKADTNCKHTKPGCWTPNCPYKHAPDQVITKPTDA